MRHNIKKGDAMNNEEQYILNRCGKQNPFTVPEGYFDSLRTELMQRVEVKPKDISLWKRWRGYVAAACMVGVVAGVATYIGFGSEATENKHVAVNVKASNVDNLSEDKYADYTMLDNDDIYSLLANN